MDFSKMTKAQIALEFEKLTVERDNAVNATKVALSYANWFSSVLEGLEKLLIMAPFIDGKGKFFKNIYWVLTNLGKVKNLIEEIFALIREWRNKVEEIKAQQAAANQPDANTVA